MIPPGTPQRFVGASSQNTPYEPPPVEIIEAVIASMDVYMSQLTPKICPGYVIDGAKAFMMSMKRWANEAKGAPVNAIVTESQKAVESVETAELPSAEDLDAHEKEHGGGDA